ncbi:MAG: sugar phosphate nucleotidyltransferase, partial [Oscillospiraceae bacterium]
GVNLIIEPAKRDTFPAVALACANLYGEKGVDPEEKIVVLPVDPYVENAYFEKIASMQNEINSDEQLVLLGVVPVKPSEKYGYIITNNKADKNDENTQKVSYFKEKPKLAEAEKLIAEGALWNCGVFGFKLKYVLDILKNNYNITDFSKENMEKAFEKLNKTSFDYEVVEKAKDIKVITYQGTWKDLGTWETLTEELSQTTIGNAILDEKCENTHIINELDVPIIAMGITNSVVVASHDGILVANKGETYNLKDYTKSALKRPMYEERRWGRYVVLEHRISKSGQEVLTKRLHIASGKQISYQYHNHRKEVWTVAGGEGLLLLNDQKSTVQFGDVVVVEKGMRHAIRAVTDLDIMEIQIGDDLVEEDIVRLDYEW